MPVVPRDLARTLDRIAARYARKPTVTDLHVEVVQPRTGFRWSWGVPDRPYFIASITKLFTTAVLMQLRREGVLDLDAPASSILGKDVLAGLVVHDGVDHGDRVTVRQLLTQTSGLPNYFDQAGSGGTSVAEEIYTTDRTWTFDELLDRARGVPSPYPPGTEGPAHYSDTNYALLGRVIESLTGETVPASVRRRVLDPLELEHTWHLTPQNRDRYDEVAPVRRKDRPIRIPDAIASFPADGGIVSTTHDQVRFLQAFVGGDLFPASYLAEMTGTWRRITPSFGPLRYGLGVMQFHLPRWQAPPRGTPPMIGHSGSFGTVTYHAPDTDVYVAAAVNQIQPQRLPYPLLARIALLVR